MATYEPTMEEPRCKTCFYYIGKKDHTFGECHKYAPRDVRHVDRFPVISEQNWCGEYYMGGYDAD